jgi:hypothetical protein
VFGLRRGDVVCGFADKIEATSQSEPVVNWGIISSLVSQLGLAARLRRSTGAPGLVDPLSEQRSRQAHAQLCCLVAVVKDGIDFDDIQRAHLAAVGQNLH